MRIPSLPDIPTLAEAAFPGFEVGSGVGLVAPAGTPQDVVETLNREIANIIAALASEASGQRGHSISARA